jgi:hypothetical protein
MRPERGTTRRLLCAAAVVLSLASGILSDPAALKDLSRVLDETTGSARPERTAAR